MTRVLKATVSYITLFHFTDTRVNHGVSRRYGSDKAGGKSGFLQRADGSDGCGRNMTKDLCAGVISSVGGAQGRRDPRGKQEGDEEELKQPSVCFLSLVPVLRDARAPRQNKKVYITKIRLLIQPNK